jgi:hypothetical protein
LPFGLPALIADEQARGVSNALASELAAEQPAGFARARVPSAWLSDRAPPPAVLGGLDLGALMRASTGEIVMATFGGAGRQRSST